jgi:hypothetical protein
MIRNNRKREPGDYTIQAPVVFTGSLKNHGIIPGVLEPVNPLE